MLRWPMKYDRNRSIDNEKRNIAFAATQLFFVKNWVQT